MTQLKHWTAVDIEFIRQHYPTMPTKEIACELGRSVGAIKSKASDLGVVKTKECIAQTAMVRYDEVVAEINTIPLDSVPLDIAYKHRDWLKLHYVQKELSEQGIAEITGCTRKNIEYWMRKFGINRRDNVTSKMTQGFRKKISETSTGRVPFSKGLTKYDHPSIMKISEKVRGDKAPGWKGGQYISTHGYRFVRVPDHPNGDKDGYVLEHRLVMEFLIGRLLTSEEVVHHRDSNRLNNSSRNLYLFPNISAHSSFHGYKKFHDPEITEERFMEEVIYAVS